MGFRWSFGLMGRPLMGAEWPRLVKVCRVALTIPLTGLLSGEEEHQRHGLEDDQDAEHPLHPWSDLRRFAIRARVPLEEARPQNRDPYRAAQEARDLIVGHAAPRRSTRRRFLLAPPQTPWQVSAKARAASRHSFRTEQPSQTVVAASVELPRPGKKVSGPIPRQAA
jgi:hypothetical protein